MNALYLPAFRLKKLFTTLLISCAATLPVVHSQEILFVENFNACTLPDGWIADLSGNPDADWYVGMPQNSASDGTTIDGTCMLIFDDDATGENTPPWLLKLSTPAFDATQFTTVNFNVDVHFRNYDNLASFKIFAFDGTGLVELATWQTWATHTGPQFSQFVRFSADLSFFANENMYLVFQYDDGGSFGWWAGIDNLEITGEGEGTNFLLETFNACSAPAGWSTQVLTGDDTWQFGLVNNENTNGETSMNGTCFAYFDDDVLTAAAPDSRVRLISPVMDVSEQANTFLDFDVIFRRYTDLDHFAVGVIDENTGVSQIVNTYYSDLGGPQFYDYIHEQIDLSAYRSTQLRVFFQYDDGNDWSWWVGLDNIKVSGTGILNDICTNAISVFKDAPCTSGNNSNAVFSGDQPACSANNVASLWYQFEATASGIVQIVTHAKFNDVITVYKGNCNALTPVACTNRDEHGFTGEYLFLDVTAGENYLIRVSGQLDGFGISRSDLCLQILTAEAHPQPPLNDLCAAALSLSVDGNCLSGNNYYANTDGPLPSANNLARGDVWYTFTPDSDATFDVFSQADFADVITVYENGCTALVEVASTSTGQHLQVESLTAGQTYYIQISGAFATIEGNLCARVAKALAEPPANDDCIAAFPLTINGDCVTASNVGANFEGPPASCDVFNSAAVWFTFNAPASGAVRLHSDADFIHTLTVFRGNCTALEEVFCTRNPDACNGYFTVGDLVPGASYFVRVSTTANALGLVNHGATCLRVIDLNATNEGFHPFQLQAEVHCLDNGFAELQVSVSGGIGAYAFQGNTNGDLLLNGDDYLIVVSDENGCERSLSGTVVCGAPECALGVSVTLSNASCFGFSDGTIALNMSGQAAPFAVVWEDGSTSPERNNLATGSYPFTVTDASGCTVSTEAIVFSPAAIVVAIDSILEEINAGANGSILASVTGGTEPFSYTWQNTNGTIVSTEEDATGLGAGTYTLQVTDANGCTYTSGPVELPLIVGTDAPVLERAIRLHPNPTSGKFVLQLSLPDVSTVEITIGDPTGRVLQRKAPVTLSHATLPFDLSEFPAGVYWLKVTGSNFQAVKRVVIAN